MQNQYKEIKELYEVYYALLEEHYHEQTDELFFGHPEDLFRPVNTTEFEAANCMGFSGGVYAHEKGINPMILGTLLEMELKRKNVSVFCNSEVIKIKKTQRGFDLCVRQPVSRERVFEASQVVNATWLSSFGINDLLSDEVDQQNAKMKVYIRGMVLADITKCTGLPHFTFSDKDGKIQTEQAAIFGMLGESGGMFCPLNKHVALLFWPSKDGAYLLDEEVDISSPWESTQAEKILSTYKRKDDECVIEESQRIMQRVINHLKKKHPFLQDARGISLIVRPTLSASDELFQRRHVLAEHPIMEEQDWIMALSTKATFAPTTALQVTKLVLQRSQEKRQFGIQKLIIDDFMEREESKWLHGITIDPREAEALILPEIYKLGQGIPRDQMFKNRAKGYAFQHEIPIWSVEEKAQIEQSDYQLTKQVAGLFFGQHLKVLDIRGSNLSSGETTDILSSMLEHDTTLIELNISHCKIKSVGILSIFKALQTARVQIIDLEDNDLSEIEAPRAVMETASKEGSSLKAISLAATQLTPKGLEEVASRLSSSQIEVLNLSDLRINDSTLKRLIEQGLGNSATLRKLLLDSNPIQEFYGTLSLLIQDDKPLSLISIKGVDIDKKGFGRISNIMRYHYDRNLVIDVDFKMNQSFSFNPYLIRPTLRIKEYERILEDDSSIY
jgi:Leucine-rich repeat (LRR) protein